MNLAVRLTAKAPAGGIDLDATTWRGVGSALGLTRGSGTASGAGDASGSASAHYRRAKFVRVKGFDTPVTVYSLHAEDVPAVPGAVSG